MIDVEILKDESLTAKQHRKLELEILSSIANDLQEINNAVKQNNTDYTRLNNALFGVNNNNGINGSVNILKSDLAAIKEERAFKKGELKTIFWVYGSITVFVNIAFFAAKIFLKF